MKGGTIIESMDTPNDAVRQGLQKIRIDLPDDAWHGVGAEWVWGQRVEDDVYTLKNSPFYATGLSYGDVVKVIDAIKGAGSNPVGLQVDDLP